MFKLSYFHPTEEFHFPHFITKSFYHSLYENSFQISPDGNTIVGIQHSELCNKLVIERISVPNLDPVIFGDHSKRIYTISTNKQFDCLLAGDYDGRVVQYKIDLKLLKCVVEHCYQNVGVDIVFSSAILGDLAVVGGCSFRIRLIDIKRKKYLFTPYETAIKHIFTMQF